MNCNECYGYAKFEAKKKNMKKTEQIDNLEKYSKYDEYASELKAMYDSFVNAGFSEQQAFILLTTAMDNAFRK